MTDRQETIADIAAEKRRIAKEVRDYASNGDYWDKKKANETAEDLEQEADRLDAAHKREAVALKQRINELNAEVAAKDEVIKRLNDAISEEQRRKMATTEKSSVVDTKFELCHYPEQVLKIGRDFQNKDGFRGAHYDTVKLLCDTIEYQQEQLKAKTEVGNAAKLREVAEFVAHIDDNGYTSHDVQCAIDKARAAIAAPARNCERFSDYHDAVDAWEKEEKCCGKRMDGGCQNDKLAYAMAPLCVAKWLLAPAKESDAFGDAHAEKEIEVHEKPKNCLSPDKEKATLEIADEMERFGKRHWMHEEGQNVRMFGERIKKLIREK